VREMDEDKSELQKAEVEIDPLTGEIFYNGVKYINSQNLDFEGGHGSYKISENFLGMTKFNYCLFIATLLTLGAGLMSGLTAGYMSIDRLELELMLKNGSEQDKRNAKKVYPVIKNHHALLVTLVIANALCMEALPIYLDQIVPAAYAILISVIAVLFFGEVIPQAVCTGTYQISIGAK